MAYLKRRPSDAEVYKLRGVVDVSCWKGIYYARRWPRRGQDTVTEANIQNISTFRAIIAAMNLVQASEKGFALIEQKDSGWTWRDQLTVAAYGNLIDFAVP